jgi:hypothetical protein
VRGNSHAPFGNRPTEKDPNQRHLAGGRVHAGGGPGKPTGGNTGRAPRVDLTAARQVLDLAVCGVRDPAGVWIRRARRVAVAR